MSGSYFVQKKYSLLTACVAYIVWLVVHCLIRLSSTLGQDAEHSLIRGLSFQIVLITLYELSVQVIFLLAVQQDSFIATGACMTLTGMGIVYHPTQLVKSELAWICFAFCLLILTLASIYMHSLYDAIVGSKSAVDVTCANTQDEKKHCTSTGSSEMRS